MAYIPFSYLPFSGESKKKVHYTLPSGGVCLSDDETVTEDGKCAYICNMDLLSDRIRTRKSLVNACAGFNESGKLNGYIKQPFYGKMLFHVGNRLFSYASSDSEPLLISDNLPDKPSLFCNFMSKIYIYCATHIYSLDSSFNFTEELAEAPLLYDGILASQPQSAKMLDVPFNLLSPRIKVRYLKCTNKTFLFPQKADISRPVTVYKNDVELKESEYVLYEDKIEINDSLGVDNERVVMAVYYLQEPEKAGFENVIEQCTLAMDFGGNASGGTRLFFTGNKDKKGYYYKSEFLNPLYAGSDEYEIIGNGSENITALEKMYGNLIVFTDTTVYRMGYTLTEDGAFFSVKEISSEAGCDCPSSVQLIDNRVVFANSQKGIFIVDSTDDTGEQNIKPISGNILKGMGMGILDIPAEAVKKAYSVDYDRKYILFADGKAYVWDYDKTAYSDSMSYSKSQKRLSWYIYDGVCTGAFIGLDGRLYAIEENDGVRLFVFDNSEKDTVSGRLSSGIIQSTNPLVRKHICTMSIKLCRTEKCSVSLELFADGEKYYEVKFPDRKKQKEKLIINLPKKALYGFGFCLDVNGSCEIEEITFTYDEISE